MMPKKSPRQSRAKSHRSPARKKPEKLYSADELESKTGISPDWWNQAVGRGDLRPYEKRRGRLLFRLDEAEAVARGQLDTRIDEAEAGEPMTVREFERAAADLIAAGQPLPPRLRAFHNRKRVKLSHRPPSPRDRDLAITYLVHCLREQGDSRPKAFKNAEKFIREKVDEAIDWRNKYESLQQQVKHRAEQNRLAGAKTLNPADVPLIREFSELSYKMPRDPVSTWAIDRHERGLLMRGIKWSQVRGIYDANKHYIAPRRSATKANTPASALPLDILLKMPTRHSIPAKKRRH